MKLDNKLHILIIPSWYPHFYGDIGGSFFREQALALHRYGHNVGVIYPQIRSLRDVKGIFIKPYGCQLENDNGLNTLRWHCVNFYPKFPKLAKNYWLKCGMELFRQYIKKFGKPDIIHVHSLLNAGYLALQILKEFNIPYVVTEHSTAYARNLISKEVIDSLDPIIKNCSKRLAVSQEFSNLLEKKTNISWSYLPNMVDNSFIKDDLFLLQSEFVLINVCLLDKKKRVDVLIRAFAKALKINPDMKLKIGGDGPERLDLEKLVDDLKISNAVTFLGLLSRKKVKEEINKSSAFVLSSEYETFGVVLVEALALGKPVIATKCGGPESIVKPEVGYLVEKNSVDIMANAIIELHNNYKKFDAKNLRKYCVDNFSEFAISGKLTEIYSQILRS